MKKTLASIVLLTSLLSIHAQDFTISYVLSTKSPGNPAKSHLIKGQDGMLKTENQEVEIKQSLKAHEQGHVLTIEVKALKETYVNLSGSIDLEGFQYDATQFYLPGFWYRKNLRSPDQAPNARVSKSWIVREDRLSTPLTGAYNETSGKGINLLRYDLIEEVSLASLSQGEVILSGPTDLGAIGFQENNNKVALTFAIPYKEAPHSYYRKLTLGDPVTSFIKMNAGEIVSYEYLIRTYDSKDFSDFVAQSWNTSYDVKQPQNVVDNQFTDQQIKETLSQFWKQSFVTNSDGLKGYSGVHLSTEKCEVIPLLEVGFVGRVLLNAFNSLEFGYEQNDEQLIEMSQEIWDSYLAHGFTKGGLFRERIEENHNWETDVFSIRRQSEGLYAALFYLNFEKKAGRKHPDWEATVKSMFELFVKLQKADGSFPRKFDDNLVVKDASGGSSSCVVPPLVMAYEYFGEKKYLEMARKVGDYQETELINKADYFSSTLDANCEDKEASLYVATSLYYLAQVTKGKEKAKYIQLAKKASYFALSWYYTWDVPFAQGQMLGDIDMKTRGWGNVSVENNHIDVYIFEFDEILDWLAMETSEPRFAAFADVIRTSMRSQLLPYEGHMVNIGKVGYYPEVVQHTQWDYGKFGKGFYNDIFAPGWTVASLWELLTVGRTEAYFN
ncbi:MAG: hypothetical protein CMB80_10495 [Flammeovirgaceae bacterium]|nr:hypothetical protein [Flammeovirgaceae bacterium]MBE62686.1 hypothetical protein [Flammeovirgaceae bacterium]HCX22666.1 hypothetical protein [Cytophagales bacterium]|tara:strand:- start:8479 stop:10482 length:2004 start_codon:yes stop_codon:yes gene_type:complete